MEKSFSSLNIHSEIKDNLQKIGFKNMTAVQEKTIPEFLEKDVVVQSQTGSGKTLSYLLPIINCILNNKSDNISIKALIITPTRELSNQISEIIEKFSIKSSILIGGIPIEEDIKKLDVEIIVGTPGRLLEIISTNSKAFNKIKYLVLDECDKLLSLGFEQKLLKILEFLPKKRTTGLFSATTDDIVLKFCKNFLNNPVFIKITEKIPQNLCLKYLIADPVEKFNFLMKIIENKKSIVFFETCNCVDFYYTALSKIDKNSTFYKIHGKMDQKDRNQVYSEFENIEKTNNHVLLCTDVAARGIDFKNIEIVVHFDVPKDYTNIVHRSGRTARMGLKGEAILLLMPNERSFINFLKLKGIEVSEIYDITDNANENVNDANNSNNDSSVKTNINDSNNNINDSNINNTNIVNTTINNTNNTNINNTNINNTNIISTNIIDYHQMLKNIINSDPSLLSLSVKAFVSYIRGYKEHILNYVLNYKELDFDGLAELFCLERIPKMTELKNIKFKNYQRN